MNGSVYNTQDLHELRPFLFICLTIAHVGWDKPLCGFVHI